jgi:hypothetical protein
MKILYLHGWQSVPGGVKPTFLADNGLDVHDIELPDEDFEAAIAIAQTAFERLRPDKVVGASRGGALAMNLETGDAPLALLCPAWKRWGAATKTKPATTILHSRADAVVPFADTLELLRNGGLDETSLVVTGADHRLADPASLRALLKAVRNEG